MKTVVEQSAVAASMRVRVWTASILVGMSFFAAMPHGKAQEEDEPVAMRDRKFWEGRGVIQMFGHVFALHDKTNVATKYYWKLDESAVGKVVELIDGNMVRVEFSDATGWQRVAVPPPETTITYDFDYDNYYHRGVDSIKVTSVTREGIQVEPREWGRVIDETGERRRVEFPVECLGLQRLRPGQRVVRGPDWRAGFADGGSRPVGPASPGDEDCWGEVLEAADQDRYVKVRWNKTGRESCYRFDKRLFYDVELAR